MIYFKAIAHPYLRYQIPLAWKIKDVDMFRLTDFAFQIAQIRFRRGLPPGDGVLYYPGEVFSASREPVASLRLERLLSGLQVNFFKRTWNFELFADAQY